MKVPMLDETRVDSKPAPTPFSNLNFDSGLSATAEGVQQLGAGMDYMRKRVEEAKRRGDVMAIADAETAYQHDITSELSGNAEDKQAAPGFLSSRGEAAVGASGPTLEKLNKRRGQIAQDLLVTDEQRRVFMTRSDGMFESARHQVESHVSQQAGVAQQATLKARVDSTLAAVPGVYTNPAEVARLTLSVEQPIRALALSPEDSNAKVAAWRSAVAETTIGQYLASRDWKGAEGTFNRMKGDLGPTEVANFEGRIATLKEKQSARTAADEAISAAIDKTTAWAGKTDGWLVPAKARAFVAAMPPGDAKDEASLRVEHQINLAQEQKKQVVEDTFDSALADYRKAGSLAGVSADDTEFLKSKKNDPRAWERLRAIAYTDAERARVLAGHGHKDAELAAAQEAKLGAFRIWVSDHQDDAGGMSAAQFGRDWAPALSSEGQRVGYAIIAGEHRDAQNPERRGRAVEQALLDVGAQNGVFPRDRKKWGDDQSAAFSRGATIMDSRLKNNPKATPEEIHGWALELVTPGRETGTGLIWENKTTALQADVAGKPFHVTDVGVIPKEDLALIDKNLKLNGQQPTDEARLYWFNRKRGFVAPAAAQPKSLPAEPAKVAPASQAANPPEPVDTAVYGTDGAGNTVLLSGTPLPMRPATPKHQAAGLEIKVEGPAQQGRPIFDAGGNFVGYAADPGLEAALKVAREHAKTHPEYYIPAE